MVKAFLSRVRVKVRLALGWQPTLETPDRQLLENAILPYFKDSKTFRRILFVGCDWYTCHYPKLFKGQEFWTMEPDPVKQAFRSEHHIADFFQNLDQYVSPGYFDAIICNGVFGWGLNSPDDWNRALKVSLDALRPGGVFVLGWNDTDLRRPFNPNDDELIRCHLIEPMVFPQLETAYHPVESENNHIFQFFQKPEREQALREEMMQASDSKTLQVLPHEPEHSPAQGLPAHNAG